MSSKHKPVISRLFIFSSISSMSRCSDVCVLWCLMYAARGVLQGDIFSPVAFIAGLDRIFRLHDVPNPGVTIGVGESSTIMSQFEYADDAALVDADAATATVRVSAIAAGSRMRRWLYRRPRARPCTSTARSESARRRRPRW